VVTGNAVWDYISVLVHATGDSFELDERVISRELLLGSACVPRGV